MKKTILVILGVLTIGLLLVIIVGVYKLSHLSSQLSPESNNEKIELIKKITDPKNATYIINNEPVTLVNGSAEKEVTPGSASKVVTTYFGNEVLTDVNNDGRKDTVFLLTQNTGGTGTFFYVVAALNTANGWLGSRGFLLGDRVSPQTTEESQNPNHQNVIVVNYVDREVGQAMTEQPTVGKSVWLKLDPDSMSFGEVEQNFPGEADPNIMTLGMKPWTWIKTQYNNDTVLQPKVPDAFTITFSNDGSVSITTDCNLMGGAYTSVGDQLSFTDLYSTKKFCDDSQEQDYAKMLSEVQSFFFTNKGELIFNLKLDSGSAVFK